MRRYPAPLRWVLSRVRPRLSCGGHEVSRGTLHESAPIDYSRVPPTDDVFVVIGNHQQALIGVPLMRTVRA